MSASFRVLATTAFVVVLAFTRATAGAEGNAFDYFAPWIEVDPDDVREMREGEVLSRTLDASGRQIAVFFSAAIQTRPADFVEVVRHPERLWKSQRVPHVVRFSDPPRIEDVKALSLSKEDVDAIRRCQPGDCDVKLTTQEMSRLQQASSIQEEFRHVILERVRRYLRNGLATTADYDDQSEPIDPLDVAKRLMLRSPWLTERRPRLTAYATDFPLAPSQAIDSFLYWIETTTTPKPTLQVVHVIIDEREHAGSGRAAEVIVISRQVFASHYTNGFLSTSTLLHDGAGSRYLAEAARLDIDGLSGWLGGIRQLLISRTLRQRGKNAFDAQRRRIEAWSPTRAAAAPPSRVFVERSGRRP